VGVLRRALAAFRVEGAGFVVALGQVGGLVEVLRAVDTVVRVVMRKFAGPSTSGSLMRSAAFRVEGRGVGDSVRCGEPGRGVQPPLREAHPLGARICAGCPVRRPCAQDAPVGNDQNHLPAAILVPAESMRPAWLRARRALLRIADGIHPCPVLWP